MNTLGMPSLYTNLVGILDIAKLSLNSTQLQLKLRLSLALIPLSQDVLTKISIMELILMVYENFEKTIHQKQKFV